MFQSVGSVAGFLAGVLLTVGLLTAPHLMPGGWGYGIGYQWTPLQTALVFAGGIALLAATLWAAGKLICGAHTWKEPGVIAGTLLIAFIANGLYTVVVEFFALKSGMRALIALIGVPVIYGNLGAVLGKTGLKQSMLNIFTGALMTMGAGFIIAALIKGW
jgi:hypothetical protein